MLLGYGDENRLAHHAVIAFDQVVREAPRALVADQGSAVLVGGLLGPGQQRKRLDRRVYAEGPRRDLLP
jgi:hypothetical protein